MVIKIDTDPSLIDVNIHPSKQDIKFSNFEDLKTLISTLIVDTKKTLIMRVFLIFLFIINSIYNYISIS